MHSFHSYYLDRQHLNSQPDNVRRAMLEFGAVASQMNDMGQTSSQLHHLPANESTMEDQEKSNDKKHKSKKSKRNSAETERPLDPEQESARALLQMRGVGVPDSRPSYYGDDIAASQQLIAESFPMQSPRLSKIDGSATRSSGKSKRRRRSDKNEKKQQRSGDIFDFPGSEEHNGEVQYPQLPSTPPGQTDHLSPSPYRPNFSQSQHALDEVPTDDETALFEEEFQNGTESVEPEIPNHDIYSFSQQPPDASSQKDTMYPAYQLPIHICTSPKGTEKPKKRKRRTTPTLDSADKEEIPVTNGAGQYTIDFDFESFDDVFKDGTNLANPFGYHEGDEMPIDPELHSMSALPPSVDLSLLDESHNNIKQRRKRRTNHHNLSQSSKRRRMEESQSASEGHGPYYSPYTLQRIQENIQDRVSPGSEDMQRQSSLELGSPFMESIARGGLEYLNNASKTKTSLQSKKGGSASATTSQKKSSQKDQQPERSLKDVVDKGGAFSEVEVTKLNAFRDSYCDANKMNYRHFNALIQSPMRGNPQITALFNDIHDVLPYRPRMSVQKFVRRRFHNYHARGTWTPEEDDMLRGAVAEKGNAWKAVGEMVDRMPGDCRDRWRNYLLNSEHRNREQWTDEEVRNLCIAILDCMQLIKDERRRAREEKYGQDAPEINEESDQEVEDMKIINWQAVSDRMGEYGGARSRLQCSFKWSQLRRKDQRDLLDVVRESQGFESKRSGPTKNPWREKRASRKIANMKTGDQYMFLQAILSCNAPVEGNIPWKALGDDAFRATWNGTDKKSAWSKMKETVRGSESMDYREVVNRVLTRILAEAAEKLDERWDPEVHGDVSQKKVRKSRKARGKERAEDGTEPKGKQRYKKNQEKRNSAKSDEFVKESDEEEEKDPEATNEPQDYNRCNTLPRPAKADRHNDVDDEATSSNADDHEAPNETEKDENAERNSLFDGSEDEREYQPTADREVSPDLAGQVQLLQYA